MHRSLRMLWHVTIAALILTGMPNGVEAGLQVGPSRVVLEGRPGQSLKGSFAVRNDGEIPLRVDVEPEDWAGGMHGERAAPNWISVRPSQFTIKPGQERKVRYKIRVPKGASGELRTQVFFTTHTEGSVGLRSRLGVIIYVAIEGSVLIEGDVTAVKLFYKASTPEIARPDRFEIVINIQNLGTVHVVPRGRAVIRTMKGRLVAKIDLPSGWGLLPNEQDAYHAIGHGVHLRPGRYLLELTTIFGEDLGHSIPVLRAYEFVLTEDWQIQLLE